MAHHSDPNLPANLAKVEYEAPELTVIGEAADVVLGVPGGGFDGPNGMSDPQFEFEPDSEEDDSTPR